MIQVHYTADPEKDPSTPEGTKWYENARRGMPEAFWRKEYEIDWFALSGELVYPQFRQDLHIIQPFPIPSDWPRYMAIDPGLRNPTAGLWVAVDPDDTLYVYDEYYVSEKIIKEHAEAILRREQGQKIYLRLIDPSSSGRNFITKTSNRDEYARYGIHCVPARNDLQIGMDRVAKLLTPGEKTGAPGIFFFSTLTHTLEEIRNYRWQEIYGSRQNDPPEKPVKRSDHLMDCLRYIAMAEPVYIMPEQEKPKHEPYRWDGMTTGY